MKTVSSDLLALWATRQFFATNLYTFTLLSGTVLRYSAADYDITWSGNTYLSGKASGPYFERDQASGGSGISCNWKVGVDPNTLSIDIVPKSATINGVPFLTACKNGVFDGATLQRDRAYGPGGQQTITGIVTLDIGRVTEVEIGRSYVTLSVADFRELLDLNMPRRIYQPGCINSLYDANCGLNKADFTFTGAATSGSTNSVINTGLTQATGYFDLGVITFTSGANAGVSRSVKTYVSSVVSVIAPFPSVPANGDTFSIYRGCGKTQAACAALGNSLKFRGFPFLPSPNTSV